MQPELSPWHDSFYPLSTRIVHWGSIGTFESDFPEGFYAQSAPAGTDWDVDFLMNLDLPEMMYYGPRNSALVRFICRPKASFQGSMPSASEIVRDLNAQNSFSSTISNMSADLLPYPGYRFRAFNDEVHNDPERQHIFATQTILNDRAYDAYEDPKEAATERSFIEYHLRAHALLQRYMRCTRLYYCLFHYRPSVDSRTGARRVSNVMLFALGISPRSGNYVGVYSVNECTNLCN